MNVEQVLAVMMDMCPQLLPILNGNNPSNSVITCDGAIIVTYDTLSDGERGVERRWEMVDLKRDWVFRDVKTEEELRKAIAVYIPSAALREIQAGYDPALPPVIGNYFYNLMYYACWKLIGHVDQTERQAYAVKLGQYLERVAPVKFMDISQKYFNAFKLGI